MAAKNRPYELFGHYILFKKLESDSLSELWRAAALGGSAVGPIVALRRFTGGNRDAIAAGVAAASRIVPLLAGTSFAKQQAIDLIDGVAVLVHDYAGGRSLRHIVEKARGGTGVQPNPMPLDQAIVIAEKVALSLATTADLRFEGNRLSHGGLIPQFVWITDDGEIRVAGQQLGGGLLASMKDARIAAEIARFFAPESLASGIESKTADSYAMGALFYLLVTGVEPPDAMTASAFTQAVRAAKTTTGGPLPDDIRAILDKSLVLDPAGRASIADLKKAIGALAHGEKYSATTFNLAFYVSTLLKKELEGEAIDRDRESKVNLAPYVEALTARPPAVEEPHAATAQAPPMFAAVTKGSKPKSKAPLAITAVVVLAAIGGGAFFMFRSQRSAPQTAPGAAQKNAATPAKPAIVSQPLVAADPSTAISTSTAAATSTAADEATRKRAFEAAVQQRLQEEMLKLQADYTKKLQQTQSKQAPVQGTTATSAPAPTPTRAAAEEPSAAQLDQRRLASRAEAATQTVVPATQTQAAAAPAPAPAAPAPPAVREGDIVDLASLDAPPRVTRQATPVYPPMALRQRAEAMVIVTALISETGEAVDVKILRGDDRFGFNEAATRAVRMLRFSPGMKEGKRVKTWFPIPVQFKLAPASGNR